VNTILYVLFPDQRSDSSSYMIAVYYKIRMMISINLSCILTQSLYVIFLLCILLYIAVTTSLLIWEISESRSIMVQGKVMILENCISLTLVLGPIRCQSGIE